MSTQRGVVRTFHVRRPASSHPIPPHLRPVLNHRKNSRQEWHLIKTQFVPFIKFHLALFITSNEQSLTMIFETMESSLERQQEMLDRLFFITPEIRHRLDTEDVPESELRRVYTRFCKKDPWSFTPWGMDSRWQWLSGGLVVLNLGLSLAICAVVLGYGHKMFAQQNFWTGPWLVLGGCGAAYYTYLAVMEAIRRVKLHRGQHSATRPDSRPTLQLIDADVSTFRYWDSNIGSEFGQVLLMSQLVLNSVERAVPATAQAVAAGTVQLPAIWNPFIIAGPVRIYLIAGVYHSMPLWGQIVAITLRQGASVLEKQPSGTPPSNIADLNEKISADQ